MATKMLNVPNHGFHHECKEIHDSWGQLNRLVLDLATRTRLERHQIRETYKAIYGEDLVRRLQEAEKSGSRTEAAGISPKLCAALSLWMLDVHERDAVLVREALQQDVTNYKALVEVFVGRKSSHILLMQQIYQTRFRTQLDQDIINIEPPTPYQKVSSLRVLTNIYISLFFLKKVLKSFEIKFLFGISTPVEVF